MTYRFCVFALCLIAVEILHRYYGLFLNYYTY